MIPFGNRPKKLPVVLGQEEVHRLIECVTVPKHRAVLLTLYAAGLRLSEATNLKLPDIDSERMQLRIIQAKGHKDRYVPLSPRLLSELREYWKIVKPTQYLFPGKMVLHTWNQRLEHHPHVHLLVPGSGPSLDGKRWIECQQTKATSSSPSKPTLVDNKKLSAEFSKRFLRKLKSRHRRGKLEIEGELATLQEPLAWAKFTDSLLEHDWCVFIQRPPTAESSPEHVLKYLARYMTGGPISDRRLVSCGNDVVTFMAREKKKGGSKRQVPVELAGVEFTRLWSLHILPKGFTKSRCFGGYSSANRTAFIAKCKRLQPPADAADEAETTTGEALVEDLKPSSERLCAKCQQPLVLIAETRRPSWRDLFYGPDHQPWFES